jgi:hypothetical protein
MKKADYKFGVYKPNKNCKPVVYKGKTYLSKIQCMVLNDLTRKEFEEYMSQANTESNDM